MIDESGLTTTTAVDVQPFDVTVYVPAFNESALPIVGFCSFEVSLFGPVHE